MIIDLCASLDVNHQNTYKKILKFNIFFCKLKQKESHTNFEKKVYQIFNFLFN